MKFDNGKPPLDLIPSEALWEIAAVFKFGADKYGRFNWRDDGGTTAHCRSYASIQRHLTAWLSGEDIDPESGAKHLAHAATQLMILMIHADEHPECDDRYKAPVAVEAPAPKTTARKGVKNGSK